jgi:hypothetical protein
MPQMKDIIILGLLIVCLASFGYGAFHHARFINAGGQKGFNIAPLEELSASARALYRAMLIGYGMFGGSIAIMLCISVIWGASVI